MKHLLITVLAAVLLVGCWNSQETTTTAKQGSSKSTKTPSVEFYEAAESDNLEVLKQNNKDGVNIDDAIGRDGKQHCIAPPLEANWRQLNCLSKKAPTLISEEQKTAILHWI